MKTERLQVLVDAEQRERLERTAGAQGVSVAALVRKAIDLVYPAEAEMRLEAAHEILAAAPMEVPSVDELRAELDLLRAGE
ncbi:MAG: antitoxin [Nocardioidaceae bacterium]|nr:MAG: antitoxin [Nocardioidaceae bacterium]